MKALFLSVIVALAISGCASSPDKIGASYVSPLEYQDYSCKQIAQEMSGVSRRASELYGQLDQAAGRDSAQMAVGLILFWPTLFFLEGGDGPEAAEYARLKGQRDALEQAAIQKNCDSSMMPRWVEPQKAAPPKKQTNG